MRIRVQMIHNLGTPMAILLPLALLSAWSRPPSAPPSRPHPTSRRPTPPTLQTERSPTAGRHDHGTPQMDLAMGAAIGVTFDHGTVSLGPGATVILPPPLAQWFDVIVHRQELTPAQPA